MISHLIDRETISRVISRPASKPANYPWADDNGWKKWAPERIVNKYDFSFDPDKANALLDQMGSTREGDVRSLNGKRLRLTVICPRPTAIRCSSSFKNLPSCPSIEQVAPMLYNTTYYTGWLITEGQETIPASRWGGFLFKVGNLKKA